MSNGVHFNGQHSSSFDLSMRSDNRQLLPDSRDEYQYAIDRDGSVLFDDALSDRFIDLSFTVLTNTGTELREKARQIANWLRTRERKRITFDDEPDKFYMGKLSTQVDIERVASMGEFTVTFRCEPYAYSNEDSITFNITDGSGNTVTVDGNGPTPPTIFLVNDGGTVNGFKIKLESEI